MTRPTPYADYLRDLVHLLREAGADARDAASAGDAFAAGREAALVEVLLLMQSQADAFMIPRSALALEDFDPLTATLRPPGRGRDR